MPHGVDTASAQGAAATATATAPAPAPAPATAAANGAEKAIAPLDKKANGAPAAPTPTFAQQHQGAPAEAPIPASENPITTIDARDVGTPDDWVPRDPRVVRLTGRHPLNCEPPMADLMASGFYTPPQLHYVRNHGAVPRLDWATHRIDIGGLVGKPGGCSITMDELVALPSVTLPITLVCAGNRRKEENMHKKSIGFNWGPCAVSTSEWTGVRLCDLIRLKAGGVRYKAGGDAPTEADFAADDDDEAVPRHVCFKGPLHELPKGDDGSYGTSVPLHYAMDPANDVLIAYKQAGRWLTPDHGFPVRLVVPGFIGGRMIKWLSEITVTAKESTNFYHYHDNRVMPPHVDEAKAVEEGWWYKPDFIINELNINSAIARPWHDELVALNGSSAPQQQQPQQQQRANRPYTVQGYAYTGGGRKVTRCEVSLDGGRTWRQADIARGDRPTPAGKHWCWVRWSLEVRVAELAAIPPRLVPGDAPGTTVAERALLVRAWDASQNGQPSELTWNVMGMMNNCYYRVRVHHHVDNEGQLYLRFQHPAPIQPGPLGTLGWREEDALARQGAAAPSADTAAAAAAKAAVPDASSAANGHHRVITMAELEKHVDETTGVWFAHEGKVYDATPFLDEHPGGAESILISAGMDATDEFNSIHSAKAKGMLEKYLIGVLGTEEEAAKAAAAAAATNGAAVAAVAAAPAAAAAASTAKDDNADPVALDPRKRLTLTLASREELSHNVVRLRFALPSSQHRFGLPVGKHVFLYASVAGETVMRAYTPTTADEVRGHFDLVVKVYKANEHPRFPDGGKMSQWLAALVPGKDTVDVKGPVGHFEYLSAGRYLLNRQPCAVPARSISLIAGGTGITPCWAVLRAVLSEGAGSGSGGNDGNDGEAKQPPVKLALLYANQTEDDILMREELEALAEQHPDQFSLYYTLDRPPEEGWAYGKGFIDEAMCRKALLPPGEGAIVAMCGPPPMIKFACVPSLEKMGYSAESLITF